MTYVPVGKNNPEVWDDEPVFIDSGRDSDWLKETPRIGEILVDLYPEHTDEDPNPEVDFVDPWENWSSKEKDTEVEFPGEAAFFIDPEVEEPVTTEEATAVTEFVDNAKPLNLCRKCGIVIEPTGKKGRPRKTHTVCPVETVEE